MLLRKGFYPYEYMDSWKMFDETSLPDKKIFSSLNIDIDYRYWLQACKKSMERL